MDIPGKLIIRTYAPVRRWLVLLVLALLVVLWLYLAYELGHYEAGFDGIGLYEGTTRGWRMADEWKAPWSLEVCSAAGRAEPQHHVRRIGAPIGRCR